MGRPSRCLFTSSGSVVGGNMIAKFGVMGLAAATTLALDR